MGDTFNVAQTPALILFLLVYVTICSLIEQARHEPRCSNITIPVTISSKNADLPSGFSFGTPDAAEVVTKLKFNVSIHSTFNIAATFCEPEVFVPTRVNTLQFLWCGKGFDGDQFSWIAYASMQGYPTLSIDRLGNGLSDHPDPITVVQIPAHVEVAHAIAQLAKAPYSPLPRAFQKVIYIGLNVKYPNDVDATILTGFSNNLPLNLTVESYLAPANVEDPARFGSLPLGYLEVTSEPVMTSTFYYLGGYAPTLALFDFETRGTISVGEAVTLDYFIAIAPSYSAPIFVVTGEFDEIFCNPTIASNKTSNCKTRSGNILAQTNALYPSARPYTWYEVPNAGHDWQLHFTAQMGFRAAHDWLASVGF